MKFDLKSWYETLSNKKCKLKLENEPIQSALLEPAPQSLLQSSSS